MLEKIEKTPGLRGLVPLVRLFTRVQLRQRF